MGKKITDETFIERANKIHNNKYQYNNVCFSVGSDKIKITCPKHGDFAQSVYDHLSGRGCPRCKGRSKTKTLYIEKFNTIHNNKYTYEKFENLGRHVLSIVTCPIHGDFLITPNRHINGCGCKKCGNKNPTSEDIIYQFKQIHNEAYNYDKVIYKSAKQKVIIICPIHGEFLMTPNKHLGGRKCPNCRELNKTKEYIVETFNTLYESKYTYGEIIDTKSKTKIAIYCPNHGWFEKSIGHHLSGQGCKKCSMGNAGKNCRSNTEDFTKKANGIHLFRYTYLKTEYETAIKSVIVTCEEHGDFLVTPNNHLRGKGCKRCHESKGERTIRSCLINSNLIFKEQHTDTRCFHKSLLRFDFVIFNNEKILLVEFQGKQHYQPVVFGNMSTKQSIEAHESCVVRDNIKRIFCLDNKIPLLEIKYNQIKQCEQLILDFIQKNG